MCLKRRFSHFFCNAMKEVVSDKCNPFPTHCIKRQETRSALLEQEIICPFTTPPALYLISELIYVLLFHCCEVLTGMVPPCPYPRACPVPVQVHTGAQQMEPGLSPAWPPQKRNCQGPLKQTESLNPITVQQLVSAQKRW